MLPIAIAFVLQSLWTILSPLSLKITLAITLTIVSLLFTLSITLFYIKPSKDNRENSLIVNPITYLLLSIGTILSVLLYIPVLHSTHTINNSIPITLNADFKIINKRYESSATIKITQINNIQDIENIPNALHANDFISTQIKIYGISEKQHQALQEMATYQALIEIRPRYFRNIPGDDQRRLQSLARNEIGYGKFLSEPQETEDISVIEQLRNRLTSYLMENYQNGSYLSALSVGKDQYLTQKDWEILRKTGTIHLISISGLHLSLTAFYGFIIFRVLAGLIGVKVVPPYKFAATAAIIIAWAYALLAGMSLPTIRAAIMFTIAMLALLTDKPIFSLQGVAIALLTILYLMPLSILMPGFSLSFVAVIILILSARILQTPTTALVFTQLIISILMIPLTASFFGEVSLMSPFINFFVIPWTSVMIMPFILIGTLFLIFSETLASPFLQLADQAIIVLKSSIELSSKIPYASITTSKPSLITATIVTIMPLILLYLYPAYKNTHTLQKINRLTKNTLKNICTLSTNTSRNFFNNIIKNTRKGIIFNVGKNIFMPLIIITTSMIMLLYINHSQKTRSHIDIYLMPVGEGLSLLLKTQDYTLLYDTGNRFGSFDAGENVILPLLKNRGIQQIDTIILSQKNLQHTGGFRYLRERFTNSKIVGHKILAPLIDEIMLCNNYSIKTKQFYIEPITDILSSCAFKIVFHKENPTPTSDQENLTLYLVSDITEDEWQVLYQKEFSESLNNKERTVLLLAPHQGRKAQNPNINPNDFHDLKILLSTKSPKEIFLNSKKTALNAYYGTIHIKAIINKNAKLPELRITDYRDDIRYWWLNTNQ